MPVSCQRRRRYCRGVVSVISCVCKLPVCLFVVYKENKFSNQHRSVLEIIIANVRRPGAGLHVETTAHFLVRFTRRDVE